MRFFAGLVFLIFFGIFSTAVAQSDTADFTISVFGGEDTEPPTTPTLLSATAISPTQIDLVWSTSTDNGVLSGYILERSIGTSTATSTIATTTLTSFSDTGLSASTTYTYAVRAFDASANYSSSSNPLTETTPDFPVVATTSDSATGEGTVARVVAEDILITPQLNSATFDIRAAFPARFEIKWGRTASYELGQVASDVLQREYSTIITGLQPGTTYEYEIIGYTPYGLSNVVDRGQFRTIADIDLTAPANVARFLARGVGEDVNLSWQLPQEDDIAFVRIVRSHLGYPTTPSEGAVIYQGLGTSAVDVGVFAEYSTAYYTAFVFDTAGNVSSGAITVAFASQAVDAGTGTGTDGVAVTPPPLEPLATTSQHMPDAFEILIKQGGREASFGEGEVTLDSDEPFLLYLAADNVTQNLKSIIVQLQDPTDQRQAFSFLLRLNEEQSAYEALIAPLQVVGKSAAVLSIYDFRALRVAEYRTDLSFEQLAMVPTAEELAASDSQLLWQFLLSIVLLLLALIWWLIAKDRADDEDETSETNKTATEPRNSDEKQKSGK